MTAVETRYRVTGMDCAACATKIETAVSRMPGVERVSVSSTAGGMTIRHATGAVPLPDMKAQLAKLGYGVFPVDREKLNDRRMPETHDDLDDRAHDHAGGEHSHFEGDGQQSWWQTRKGMLT